ncbi:UNVERIFIED_CONTAM: Scopoletin glucosyltransferase [Sesamum latifolium]|uniref:Scopoletin glucosyltransferase n=1 Tax=Sesamum latifolium TaxID=2727402 RepID=A0AAW2UHM0_9LAMI
MITVDLLAKFFEALALLQELLQELSLDCLISDMFFPWIADSVRHSQIGFPWDELLRTMWFGANDNDKFAKPREQRRDSERRRYGVVFNNFYELESAYADHYKKLHEMAVRLEASGQEFIWVARKGKNEGENEDWIPQEYEDRIKGRELVIRGWAPQVMILDHPTHCWWNSTLEGICAGVPMVTWPVSAEQFYNEKLVTKVLRTGVPVGSKKWADCGKRRRAKKAVEEEGSSYNSLSAFVDELSIYRSPPKKQDIN